MKFEKILMFADDSPVSRNAVKEGYEFALSVGAKVTLVYVIEEALAMGDVDAGIFPDEALITLQTEGEKLLSELKNEYGKGVITDLLLPVGELGKVIPGVIKKTDAKLVITGTHQRTGIDRLIEGSVAERVLRIATVPVLVVPLGSKNS